MNIIYQDVIAPYVPTADAKPDWNELALKVKAFGAPGDEIFLRAKTIHLYNQQDWNQYATTANEYIDKYGANLPEQELKSFKDALLNAKQTSQ